MTIVIFLHIISMFTAVALFIGVELLLGRIVQTRDVRAIRAAFRTARPLSIASRILFGFGLIFGLIAAYLGFNLLAPWLLIAYVLFIVVNGIDGAITTPWERKVGMAATSSPDDKPSAELEQLIENKTSEYALWITIVAIVLIVFDMVLKPFS